jgi:hypothetical protein
MTPPLPLLENATKQELPHPVSPKAVNIAAQRIVLGKWNLLHRMKILEYTNSPTPASAEKTYSLQLGRVA